MNLIKNIVALLASIAMVSIPAALGAGFGPGAWYDQINKPAWNPPNWIFGPVWTTLYLMMAVSSWLVWRQRATKMVSPALALYGLQLVLNALWSPLFFGARLMGVALVEILLLEACILATIVAFYRVRPLTAYLLVPYACWVAFASFLNFTLWRLN